MEILPIERSKEWGRKIKELRQDNDYTQQELAEEAGVSSVIISKLENGNFEKVSLLSLMKVLKVLGYKLEIVPKGAQLEKGE
ncbi:MAG: XRE family transcriptional regulator [Campylobacterales bacterium]